MMRGEDRTDGLAGGLVAVLTEHGKKRNGGVFLLKKTFDPEPGHLPSLEDLFFFHDGDVVLRVTGDDAGAATGTAVKINGHGPTVTRMGVGRVDVLF